MKVLARSGLEARAISDDKDGVGLVGEHVDLLGSALDVKAAFTNTRSVNKGKSVMIFHKNFGFNGKETVIFSEELKERIVEGDLLRISGLRGGGTNGILTIHRFEGNKIEELYLLYIIV